MFACELEAKAEDAYLDGVVCLDLLVFDGVLLDDIVPSMEGIEDQDVWRIWLEIKREQR